MHTGEMNSANTISDNELIRRILNGEKDLYALIVRRYNQRLYRIAMSIIYDDAEAEDVMQTAYMNAYLNLAKFSFNASFSTWLTRIMINECLLRLKRRGRSVSLDDAALDVIMNDNVQIQELKTPINEVMNTELKTILDAAIRDLPEIYRSVFVMRELENMSVADTQECLGISENNVKVRLNRAKAMLKSSLSMFYDKEEIMHFQLKRCDRVVASVMEKILDRQELLA